MSRGQLAAGLEDKISDIKYSLLLCEVKLRSKDRDHYGVYMMRIFYV